MDPLLLDKYNRYGVLKPPVALYLAMFVLSKFTWLAIAVALSHGRSKTGGAGGLSWETIQLFPLIWEMPVILVALTLFQRAPTGATWARRIWPKGLWLLRFAALIQTGLAISPLLKLEFLSDDFIVQGVILLATMYALGYLVLSKFLPLVFSEFPEPAPKTDDAVK